MQKNNLNLMKQKIRQNYYSFRLWWLYFWNSYKKKRIRRKRIRLLSVLNFRKSLLLRKERLKKKKIRKLKISIINVFNKLKRKSIKNVKYIEIILYFFFFFFKEKLIKYNYNKVIFVYRTFFKFLLWVFKIVKIEKCLVYNLIKWIKIMKYKVKKRLIRLVKLIKKNNIKLYKSKFYKKIRFRNKRKFKKEIQKKKKRLQDYIVDWDVYNMKEYKGGFEVKLKIVLYV